MGKTDDLCSNTNAEPASLTNTAETMGLILVYSCTVFHAHWQEVASPPKINEISPLVQTFSKLVTLRKRHSPLSRSGYVISLFDFIIEVEIQDVTGEDARPG